jgi:homocysteine S-methyltransferase
MSQIAGIDHLRRLRADGHVVVIDGGMGTELERQGAEMDHEAWSGLVNVRDPELVRRVHAEYVRAGADVLITNTFMSGCGPLERAGETARFEEANRTAVRAATMAAQAAADRRILVAGSVSANELCAPETRGATGARLHRRLHDGYLRQVEILVDEGVDMIVIEMADHPRFTEPAVEAAAGAGVPLWLGLCVHADRSDRLAGRMATVTDDHRAVLGLAQEDGFDAVCVMHTDLADVPAALAFVSTGWSGPIGVYPHYGVWLRPHWEFADLPIGQFVEAAREWHAAGATMIGGCCGIGPGHIAALRSAAQPGL